MSLLAAALLLILPSRGAAQSAFEGAGEELSSLGRLMRPQGSRLTLRFPSWELAALMNAEALSGPSRPLTSKEIEVAETVFGDALDYSRVRVAGPAASVDGTPQTWGNTIRSPGSGMTWSVFIHEMVHVWQYQTKGSGYISDSLLANACALLTHGDRNHAYKYAIVEGQSFHDYPAEHQAEIVEHYYRYKKYRADPRYQRLVAEMRRSKAVRGGEAMFMERDAGLPPRQWAVPPPEDDSFHGRGVPQVELRF